MREYIIYIIHRLFREYIPIFPTNRHYQPLCSALIFLKGSRTTAPAVNSPESRKKSFASSGLKVLGPVG